jgi:hypothetical protein
MPSNPQFQSDERLSDRALMRPFLSGCVICTRECAITLLTAFERVGPDAQHEAYGDPS